MTCSDHFTRQQDGSSRYEGSKPAFMKPFGLYVHVPFCDGKCHYCAFYSTRYEADLADRCVAAIEKEFAFRSNGPGRDHGPFDTIYFGGGTPTILSDTQLERLCTLATQSRGPTVEWTVEANPGTVSRSRLELLKRAGVNRISLGAQAFDDDILLKLGRRHTAEDTAVAAAMIREAGFTNLGIDLITCIPGVDIQMWQGTLDKALALAPQHISVYALTVEEGTFLSEMTGRGEEEMLDDLTQLELLRLAEEVLNKAGYGRYEISNYAIPGFECRHNLACWRGSEYVGLGPSASSHVGNSRWTNVRDLAGYLSAIEGNNPPVVEVEALTKVMKATEMVIFGLRMADGINIPFVRGVSGITSCEEKKLIAVFQRLLESGVVESRGDDWVLTDRGRDVADTVAVELIGWEDGSPVT
ncbi:MAG: radical SAM family heme chaperone HemW [bacterium]